MKIYTKTGDKGLTSLIGGTRVPKHHLRIESYGTVDELNAFVGLIRDQQVAADVQAFLKNVQDELFVIGSSLATDPDRAGVEERRKSLPVVHDEHIAALETEMDKMDAVLPPLRHFVLPGGNTAVSYCHVARCVCRRAERIVIHLADESFVDEKVIIYLNRLSDYLFVLGRKLCFDAGIVENQWIPSV